MFLNVSIQCALSTMDGQEVLTDSAPISMDNAYVWRVSLQVVESTGGAQTWI